MSMADIKAKLVTMRRKDHTVAAVMQMYDKGLITYTQALEAALVCTAAHRDKLMKLVLDNLPKFGPGGPQL